MALGSSREDVRAATKSDSRTTLSRREAPEGRQSRTCNAGLLGERPTLDFAGAPPSAIRKDGDVKRLMSHNEVLIVSDSFHKV